MRASPAMAETPRAQEPSEPRADPRQRGRYIPARGRCQAAERDGEVCTYAARAAFGCPARAPGPPLIESPEAMRAPRVGELADAHHRVVDTPLGLGDTARHRGSFRSVLASATGYLPWIGNCTQTNSRRSKHNRHAHDRLVLDVPSLHGLCGMRKPGDLHSANTGQRCPAAYGFSSGRGRG